MSGLTTAIRTISLAALLGLALSACGGGGDSAEGTAPSPAPNLSLPPAPPPVTDMSMPTVDDERAAYPNWGWTWTASKEPAAVTEPISNYFVRGLDVHNETEGDDLWTYLM